MKQSVYKVPDGKLIKVKVWTDEDTISKITITGDFFLHPEHVLEKIETNLIGVVMNESRLVSIIDETLHAEQATFIGAVSSDLSHAILKAE
ncbi:MAG: lipoate protein ligase C-terminal domain-containing protein [Candidatus Thorarchaeota archaeon]|jgi:lipoate-protein ligase A